MNCKSDRARQRHKDPAASETGASTHHEDFPNGETRLHKRTQEMAGPRGPQIRGDLETLSVIGLTIHNLMEQLEDLLFATDNSGFITFVSPSSLRMFGWKPEEMVARSFIGLLSESGNPDRVAQFRDTLASGQKSLNISYMLKRKDGSVFPGEMNSSAILKDGHRVGRIGVIRDITKRRQAEEALHRAEENFRRSLDDSPLGVRIVTLEGDTLYANRAILDIYGYDSLDELKATPVRKRYTRESHAEFRLRREKRRQGIALPAEYTIDIIRKNGEVRHLRVFRKEILWDGKRQFQTIYDDMTDRQQAEKEVVAKSRQLEEANAALRVLLQHVKEDQRKTETTILANIQKLVLPSLERLRALALNKPQQNCLDIVASHLQQITSSFLKNLETCFADFTPREIEVATMIRTGRTSKEIANIFNVSTRSVDFHRNNIRRKLGLSHKKSNLRICLMNLSGK